MVSVKVGDWFGSKSKAALPAWIVYLAERAGARPAGDTSPMTALQMRAALSLLMGTVAEGFPTDAEVGVDGGNNLLSGHEDGPALRRLINTPHFRKSMATASNAVFRPGGKWADDLGAWRELRETQ